MTKKNTNCRIFVLELIFVLALAFYNNVCAYDPSPLQDFCVATDHPEEKGVYVNGKFCKDPKNVTADDFFYSGIDAPTDIDNIWGVNGTLVDVDKLKGLNTMGVSVAYAEYAPKGLSPPVIHPRASEIMVVQEGRLEAGFVTSNLDGNRLFTKTLKKGDVFVFPIGLVHFTHNVGDTRAVTFHAYGSQNPGVIVIPSALFGSSPLIERDVLAKSFDVKEDVIKYLQSINWPL